MSKYYLLQSLVEHPEILRMKLYKQHHNTSTYQHVIHVALFSCWLAKRFRWNVDQHALIRGAILHDYYLYDIEAEGFSAWKHGTRHAKVALELADEKFCLSKLEKDIIYSHMWPLNITHVPKSKEAFIVCMADKWCAVKEIFMWRKGNAYRKRKNADQ